jgi:hypothetical protein
MVKSTPWFRAGGTLGGTKAEWLGWDGEHREWEHGPYSIERVQTKGPPLRSVIEGIQRRLPITEVTGISMPDPNELSFDQVARIIKGAGLARAFFAAVEKRGLVDGIAGSPPPGMKVVMSRGKA